jgi:hypothetical protein
MTLRRPTYPPETSACGKTGPSSAASGAAAAPSDDANESETAVQTSAANRLLATSKIMKVPFGLPTSELDRARQAFNQKGY